MVFYRPQQDNVGTSRDAEEAAILPEEQPLLPKASVEGEDAPWIKPDGFFWVEVAIFSNVFLAGFDGTVTASSYAVISSEFMSSNLASWITTSYLVTSTALQPLYGRFSDIFGRRVCLFVATTLFGLGCLGCALSPDLVTLNLMRALTGIGGGGLMTMGKHLAGLLSLRVLLC
jgi:MFS family permease